MNRLSLLLTLCLVTVLTACAPAAPSATPTGLATPILGAVSVSTAAVATVMPVLITSLPSDSTPPPTSVPPTLAPVPPLPGGLGPTELKYRLLAQFPDIFFCDPDFYPVARADETDLARQLFPGLQANPEEFNAILSHNQLTGLSTYTGEQKLLIYREHKKLAAVIFELAGEGYHFQLQVLNAGGKGESITGLINGKGEITVEQRTPSIATCPICLAEGTLIDTPSGPLPVQDLRLGMLVWTQERTGERVAKPVLQIGKTVVPSTHQVVHLVLDDGRELWVSPAHPSADGRPVGQLRAGDRLDGGIIFSAISVRYESYATYDLLPAGQTGFYWANGILLASTLKDSPEFER
jgi:hypothetical protein